MTLKISRKIIIIISILAFFIVFSFILRALPVQYMDFSTYHLHQDPDTWYNFRQIEVMVSNFPQYNWFDPMTAFPSGKEVAWGPVFPIFAAILSLIFGATQRFDIMMVASWIPVLFGLFMIPVMFYLAQLIGDWKTGLISAIFIAVVSGNYFYESYFGVVDHHIAEVLFTSIFSLFYISAIIRSRKTEISLCHPQSLKILLIPSFLAGIAFGISLLTSPTSILFLVIVGIYTILQYSWDISHDRTTDFLLIINCIAAFIPLLFLGIDGIPSSTYSLMNYSIAQIHIIIIFILGTVFLQILSMIFKGKPYLFTISVFGTIIAVMGVFFLVRIPILSPVLSALATMFNPGDKLVTINELKPWSLGQIWVSLNIGIILALVGLIFLIYRFIKKENPANLYISVWAVLILFLTSMQIRWEYYSAVVISLLSAYILGTLLTQELSEPSEQMEENIRNSTKSGKKKEKKISTNIISGVEIFGKMKGIGILLVLVCLPLFCGISVLYDYAIVRNTNDKLLISSQWVDTLEWIQTGTPDPGISYFGPYVSEGWQYPLDSYGILSWWDSGHWITYIAKRIPVTNPFQDNVESAARFFLTESEDEANEVADSYGVRYVITDSQMTFGKFPGMIQWYNASLQTGYYSNIYYLIDSETPGNSGLIGLINQPYYSTMIIRLQNFDGSLASPDQVVFAVVTKSQDHDTIPTITTIDFLDYSTGLERLNVFDSRPHDGESAVLKGFLLNSPVEKVDALRHYRLVYENATIMPDGNYDFTTSVKVFEYIPGARLPGVGLIEVKIRTNLGRTFVYRQEAEDGFFILPYSTEGGSYPVTTIGPYHIVSSGRTIEIAEDDVIFGKTIS
jgi:oligosaccharyl transferase (archaeosortase A-associated)